MTITEGYFNCTERERAVFEAGIKLASLYHQYMGAPVNLENIDSFEAAMEEGMKAQPYVKEASVEVDREIVRSKLGYKYHWAVSDYLQRSARHTASKTDVEQAYAVGQASVRFALAGKSGVMPVIRRVSNKPYRWTIGETTLGRVANREKKMPRSFISSDGFGITAAAKRYLAPLIRGEDYPPFDRNGLPKYVRLKNILVQKYGFYIGICVSLEKKKKSIIQMF